MLNRKWQGLLFAGCVLVGFAGWDRAAYAETQLAADLDFAVPLKSNVDAGGGFGVRLGGQAHWPPFVATPELAFTFDSFGSSGDLRVYRGVGGLRLGVGEIIRPGAFAHIGVGNVAFRNIEGSHTDLTYDAGAFLDITLLPLLDIGGHAAYNHVVTDGSDLSYMTVGAHVALIF
jgi:hypothetical protein